MQQPQLALGRDDAQLDQRDPWTIVSQVKSNRIVYFTDDQHYQPATEGDWYYVSTFAGALPVGMTLRNCWGWRFNGGVFTDARVPTKKSARQLLIDNNRKALLRILNDKIDQVRSPYQPDCTQGAWVRQQKLIEAQHFLTLDTNADALEVSATLQFPMLTAVATARNISMLDAVNLITFKAAEAQQVLAESERFREQLKQAIEQAVSESQLLEVREWLLDKVYPALSKNFKYPQQNTEPADWDAPIKDVHKLHEVTRLKTQLREAINKARISLHSDYIQNDEIRKHKAKLAQTVLASQGVLDKGLDVGLIQAYAQARNLTLSNAAQLILASMSTAGQLLAQTEKIKDNLLARIEAIKSLRDIRQASRDIADIDDMHSAGASEAALDKTSGQAI